MIGTLVLLWSINRSDPAQKPVATSSCKRAVTILLCFKREIDQSSAAVVASVEMKACQYVITEPFVLKSNVHLKGAGFDKTTIMIESELEDGTANEQ